MLEIITAPPRLAVFAFINLISEISNNKNAYTQLKTNGDTIIGECLCFANGTKLWIE